MISASSKLREIMRSNVRPKCEPKIELYGTDNEGNEIRLEWNGGNIQGLTYRRGIDIIGRETPYMELSWTELYSGRFDESNFPEKYKNITKYMKVKFSFVQNLSYGGTWGDLSQFTWEELSQYTWAQLSKFSRTETVEMPIMYLSARPVVEGNKIKWTAVDLMSFLTENQLKGFCVPQAQRSGVPFVNPPCYMLLNARSAFLENPPIFEALSQTVARLQGENWGTIDKPVLFNDNTKSGLVNYASLRNLYWDFRGDDEYGTIGLKSKKQPNVDNLGDIVPEFTFTSSIIREYPAVTAGTDISSYNFKNYVFEFNPQNTYKKAGEILTLVNGVAEYVVFRYDNFGTPATAVDGTVTEVDFAYSATESEIDVIPLNVNGYDNKLINSTTIGESYVENNPLNPYASVDEQAQTRFAFLKEYFNKDCTSLEWSGLHNPLIELGDIVSVPTNLYRNDERVTKTAYIVATEIEYSGAWKQKFYAHEVRV